MRGQVLLRSYLDEYEEGRFVAVSNFGCETDFGQGLDQFGEIGFGLGTALGRDLVVDNIIDAGGNR